MTNDMLNNATRVYVGLDRACRCGCRGSYHDAGSVGFKRAVNRFRKLLANDDADDLTVAETYLNLSFGENRAICIYIVSDDNSYRLATEDGAKVIVEGFLP